MARKAYDSGFVCCRCDFFKEPQYELLLQKLVDAEVIGIGAPTVVECGIVVSARMNSDARGLLSRFLSELDVAVIPFSEAHFGIALGAWLTYGKGRHLASLNFGDCLAYAVAQLADQPLLCTGDDFPATDLALA